MVDYFQLSKILKIEVCSGVGGHIQQAAVAGELKATSPS